MVDEATNNEDVMVLRMNGIEKSFPGVKALDAADLEVRSGEIHGLVGENGAGKSTIIKVLAGVYAADGGTIEIGGQVVEAVTPQRVHELGVRFIHQEVSLVPHFTVAESVFLGQELSGPLGVRSREMKSRAERFLRENLGVEISASTLVRDLTVAERKLVQIVRALIDGDARLVVFDEPTAVLAAADIKTLFAAIEQLRSQGISIIYVSHYLSEIQEITDRVTVFRQGQSVGEFDMSEGVETSEIIRMMVGREIAEMYPERKQDVDPKPVLEITDLGDGARFSDVSFTVGAGEIVGLAGIIGSGREELVDTIYGLRKRKGGTLAVDGVTLDRVTPPAAVKKGLVLVPRDRRGDGLVLEMSVSDNINLATLEEVSTRSWLWTGKAKERSDQLVAKLDVRPRSSERIVQFLSGGNQQKVVLGRWLATESRLFLLDDPTVGVDVGARSEIYKLITTLAADGAGVLVSSNDLGELLGICDRVVVMVRGQAAHTVDTDDLSQAGLLALITGAATDGEAA